MSLRDDIHANAACAPHITTRDCAEIAKIMSTDRVVPNQKMIGNGTVLEVLGMVSGNAFLDVINTEQVYRHVKPLVEQGRLLIGSPLAQLSIQSMVPVVLTKVEADQLCAIGQDTQPYTVAEISDALYYPNGNLK